MPALTVVVTFYSRGGSTESLAHATAVGAVQGRALIRLRRVPDADEAGALQRFADCRDALRRMHKEYVGPREADVAAADVLVVASPADVFPTAAEWQPFLTLLEHLHAGGKLAGKVAAVVRTGPSTVAFETALRRFGLDMVTDDGGEGAPKSDVDRAVALGRRAVAAAETQRHGEARTGTSS